jgi:ATP-dependent DNA helicase DinG
MNISNSTPVDLGAPAKFDQWREGQLEALTEALNSPKRFTALCLPTGAGKTLIYMVLAYLQKKNRTYFLTSTKAQQDQLSREFSNLVDIRGMNNYPCKPLDVGGEFYDSGDSTWDRGCDRGPCRTGYGCRLRENGCLYFDRVRKAELAPLVSTNYAYWMAGGKSIGKVDLLVLDEAHKAPEELAGFLSTSLSHLDIEGTLGSSASEFGDDPRAWSRWAMKKRLGIKPRLEALAHGGSWDRTLARELRALERLDRKLKLITLADDDWIVEIGKNVTFDPIWPRRLSKYLFRGVEKVVLVSATVRKKTCELLGIDPDDLNFYESGSVFDISRRPLIHVPTVRLNFRSTPEELRTWVVRIDQIIDKRRGLSGIIHTVSYKRKDYLLSHSRHAERMLTHDTASAARVIAQFKISSAGTILVSPSASTGYDFPGRECRWQIMAKMPFPDTRSKILKARCKHDKDYAMYLAMQELVQASGRGMRASDDWCDNFVVDDNVSWFLNKYKKFSPDWFAGSYRKHEVIPACNFLNKVGSGVDIRKTGDVS